MRLSTVLCEINNKVMLKQAKITNNSYTHFGNWFFSQPRVVRQRKLKELEALGLTGPAIRAWMYRPIVPKPQFQGKVEKITGIPIELLFPY